LRLFVETVAIFIF